MNGASKLDALFASRRREGGTALVLYLTAGYPQKQGWVDLAVALLEAGADVLEIGIPFSDPLLDGPAIQRSQQIALDEGVTPALCMAFARELAKKTEKPLLFMGAYNPVLAYGEERFCADAKACGLSGLIVPDLPYEEQGRLLDGAHGNDLHLIQLVAPTSTEARLKAACDRASGFIYGISVAGVTGARASIVETAQPLVERVRKYTDVPVAVGFGIAGADQARLVSGFADGVIVGSALINALAGVEIDRQAEVGAALVADLRRGTDARIAV